jgi:hypothetical protein
VQQPWSMILGAALALLGGILGGITAKLFTDRFIEAPGLRAAIAAEIRAVLDLIQRDNLVCALAEQITAMEHSQKIEPFRVAFRSTYNIIFTANASKLNLLPRWLKRPFDTDLVPTLVNYYYLLQTMIELSEMIAASDQTFFKDHKPILGLHIPPRERLSLFNRLKNIANELQPLAQDLVNRLEGVA